jgi:hypothetical protein
MSRNEPALPGWAWIVVFLLALGVLGQMTGGAGSEGNGNLDDGCSSTLSATQGCYP